MYERASTNNPLGFRPWNFATSRNGLAFYSAQGFPIPQNNGTPGMGSFVQDPTTLPPAPAGYTYQLSPDGITSELVALPKPAPDYNPVFLLAIAGFAAWEWYKHHKTTRLPVVPMVGARP